MATLVLVHGAGHTSRVWRRVQAELQHPSIAVDLPGRHDRHADITRVTIDDAARSIAHDVEASPALAERKGVVLVGHSVGGIVLPALAARLGPQVEHLVFVAGLIAPHDATVVDTVRPEHAAQMTVRLNELRDVHRDQVFRPTPTDVGLIGAAEITDARVAMGIDSLNYMVQTVSWDGVDPALPRTFVRPDADTIQPPELQARLVRNSAASEVIDLESGHTPAIDAPVELAAILDGIAGRYEHLAP